MITLQRIKYIRYFSIHGHNAIMSEGKGKRNALTMIVKYAGSSIYEDLKSLKVQASFRWACYYKRGSVSCSGQGLEKLYSHTRAQFFPSTWESNSHAHATCYLLQVRKLEIDDECKVQGCPSRSHGLVFLAAATKPPCLSSLRDDSRTFWLS